MIYAIDRDNILYTMTEIAKALNGKQVNSGEAILALSEMAGVIIAESTDNYVQCKQLIETVMNHMVAVINAKGKSLGKELIKTDGE